MAGVYPFPFSVMTCTITGPLNLFATWSAFSIKSSSWPSTGPRYFKPKSSNKPCGAKTSLMPFFIPCKASNTGLPMGDFSNVSFPQSRTFSYISLVLKAAKCVESPPIVGEYDLPLSLTIMTKGR